MELTNELAGGEVLARSLRERTTDGALLLEAFLGRPRFFLME